jgi:hypothetical protein
MEWGRGLTMSSWSWERDRERSAVSEGGTRLRRSGALLS